MFEGIRVWKVLLSPVFTVSFPCSVTSKRFVLIPRPVFFLLTEVYCTHIVFSALPTPQTSTSHTQYRWGRDMRLYQTGRCKLFSSRKQDREQLIEEYIGEIGLRDIHPFLYE